MALPIFLEDGPFSRLARDGSGEGDGRWREEPDFEGRRQRRLAAAAGTEDGDDNGELADDDAASDRRVQRFERRRTLIGLVRAAAHQIVEERPRFEPRLPHGRMR
eukprot:SAG31_NODE_3135_length_4636_cov_7.918448_8_plen_105_part_00